jgi:hypothetical protein
MYLVIRCGSCGLFSYVDRFQEWKLCPVCGESIDVRKATVYLEVEDFRVADRIVQKLDDYLRKTKKRNLSAEEMAAIRREYAEWLRAGQ